MVWEGKDRDRRSSPIPIEACLCGRPPVGKPDFEQVGGMEVRYCRMSGLLMQLQLAAGPYGVREIGLKSQWRALWPWHAS